MWTFLLEHSVVMVRTEVRANLVLSFSHFRILYLPALRNTTAAAAAMAAANTATTMALTGGAGPSNCLIVRNKCTQFDYYRTGSQFTLGKHAASH